MISRWFALFTLVIGASASAQTTQGLISGRLQSSVTGAPIAAATVTYSNFETNSTGTAQSDKAGYYYLPLCQGKVEMSYFAGASVEGVLG